MQNYSLRAASLLLTSSILLGCGNDTTEAVFVGSDNEIKSLKQSTDNGEVTLQAYYFTADEVKEVNSAIRSFKEFTEWSESEPYDINTLTTQHDTFNPLYDEIKKTVAKHNETWNKENQDLLTWYEKQFAQIQQQMETSISALEQSNSPTAKLYIKRHQLGMQYSDFQRARWSVFEDFEQDVFKFVNKNKIKFPSRDERLNATGFAFSTTSDCEPTPGYSYITTTTMKSVIDGKPTDVCAGVTMHNNIVNHPNFDQLEGNINSFHEQTVKDELAIEDLVIEFLVLDYKLVQEQIDNQASYLLFKPHVQNLKDAVERKAAVTNDYELNIVEARNRDLGFKIRKEIRGKRDFIQLAFNNHYLNVLTNKEPVTQSLPDITKQFSIRKDFDAAVIFINGKSEKDRLLALVIDKHQNYNSELALINASEVGQYRDTSNALFKLYPKD